VTTAVDNCAVWLTRLRLASITRGPDVTASVRPGLVGQRRGQNALWRHFDHQVVRTLAPCTSDHQVVRRYLVKMHFEGILTRDQWYVLELYALPGGTYLGQNALCQHFDHQAVIWDVSLILQQELIHR
jgi:hypothetical protein